MKTSWLLSGVEQKSPKSNTLSPVEKNVKYDREKHKLSVYLNA